MKSTTMTIAMVLSVVAFAAVQARPMHAGIDYQRYLQVKDNVSSELDDWLSKYEEVGLENGWVPASEARSADDVAEDRKQRFFMTKQLLGKLEKEQPDAQFTTDTPFSLLTEDEFAKYVRNSYLAKGSSSLRGYEVETDAVPKAEESVANDADVTPTGAATNKTAASIPNFLKNLNFTSLKEKFSSFQSMVGGLFKKTSKEAPKDAPTTEPKTEPKAEPTEAPTEDSTEESTEVTRRLQTSHDWSDNKCNAPPQQQGSCGACWAFATIGVVETVQCLAKGGSVVKLSEQQMTSCDRTNGGCGGGTIGAGLRYIQQNGLCTSTAYPYASSAGRAPACSATCQKTPVPMKGITRVTGEAGLVTALNKQPVVLAVHAGNSVWKQYKSGIVASCPTSRVDHAVIAIGYDTDSIKIKNSWGTRWGEKGYVRLKRGVAAPGTCGVLTDMSYPQV